MTKLEEEIKEAYDISHDVYGHELDEEELIKNVSEVAKKYIEKAFLDGCKFMVSTDSTNEEDCKVWLKENGVIE